MGRSRRSSQFVGLTLGLTLGAASLAASPVTANSTDKSTVRSTYIVTFVDGTDPRAEVARMRAQNYSVSFVYETVFPGMAIELTASAAQSMARNPRVARVEPDGIVTASATITQSGATWGLDRVDQANLPLNGTYQYPDSQGSGVNAYIIDTGILAGHVELSGRVKPGFSSIKDRRGTTDCNGHGTHVAGTVAGTAFGVAKSASVVPVRVLDCRGSGTWSGVIAGIDWTARNHVKPAVANMSLGGGASASVDDAVRKLVAAGVTVVVAAGNSNVDACTASPAREPSAVTVGATQSNDARASYSNYGACLDIFAPGTNITSAWNTSTTATRTISGTSMASPHVAGVAALLLGANTSWTPAQVASALTGRALTATVGNPGPGSPNLLLNLGTWS
ncbi:MAG: S8 family peptidase [Actinomycetota bacterium]